MKYKSYLIIGTCVATLSFSGVSSGLAQSKKSSPSPSPVPAKAGASASPAKASTAKTSPASPGQAIAFRGTATSVDQSAKTFTIAGKSNSRVFKVTDKTAITKGGNSAAFSELTDNEKVTGSYWKHEDGSLEAKSLKIGGQTDAEKANSSTKKSKKGESKGSESPSPAASPSPAKQ